jgi:hypothetical protein
MDTNLNSSIFIWLAAAPQGAIALLTATLAAAAALLVVFLTQWILGRRARTELLTKKLEELYLSLNDVLAHNLKRVEGALPLFSGSTTTTDLSRNSSERQGLDLHKKIIMYVRLYFPKLSASHQNIFHRNSAINMLIYSIESGIKHEAEELLELSYSYRDAVVAMEEEIINNRNILVKDQLFFRKYNKSKIKESKSNQQQPPPK